MFSLASLRCYGVKFQRGKYTIILSTLSKARSHHCAIHKSINLKLKESSSRQFSNSSQDQQNTKPSSWIESEYVPTKIRPYLHLARADKQAGTLLLMWPCFWYTAYNHLWFYSSPSNIFFPTLYRSVCLATPMNSFPDVILLVKFATGALIMRGYFPLEYNKLLRRYSQHWYALKHEYKFYVGQVALLTICGTATSTSTWSERKIDR